MKKRLKMAIGLILAAIGIGITAVSVFIVGPCCESQLSRVSGAFSEYIEQDQAFRSVVVAHGILLEDGRTYIIDSDTQPVFEEDAFLSSVTAGDPIELIVREDESHEPAVLAIYHNGQEFMDFEASQNARQTNQTIGIILGALLFLGGLVTFLSYIRAKSTS